MEIAFQNIAPSIKTWSPDDRPREKFIAKGSEAMSDAELLAILLGTGSREQSVLELARDLLFRFETMDRLARATFDELMAVKGVGPAKATILSSAFELCRRRSSVNSKPDRVRTSQQAAVYLHSRLRDLHREVFFAMFLNRNNEILEEKLMTTGGLHSTVVDIKLIIREACVCRASSIIIAHNHLSHNHHPSKEDISITNKLRIACEALDLKLKDHVIVSRSGYYSFCDQGRFEYSVREAQG